MALEKKKKKLSLSLFILVFKANENGCRAQAGVATALINSAELQYCKIINLVECQRH